MSMVILPLCFTFPMAHHRHVFNIAMTYKSLMSMVILPLCFTFPMAHHRHVFNIACATAVGWRASCCERQLGAHVVEQPALEEVCVCMCVYHFVCQCSLVQCLCARGARDCVYSCVCVCVCMCMCLCHMLCERPSVWRRAVEGLVAKQGAPVIPAAPHLKT